MGPKGVTPIDILHLIDRLEDLLEHGWRLPLGNKVAIDEDLFLNIIDQMRIVIPQEIKQAREVQQERDRYVAQAHEEARRIIAQAREDAAQQLDEHKLRKAAEAQAEAIIQRAQQEAARIHSGADEYAEAKLKELSENLSRLQSVIQNGINLLENRRTEYAGQFADGPTSAAVPEAAAKVADADDAEGSAPPDRRSKAV